MQMDRDAHDFPEGFLDFLSDDAVNSLRYLGEKYQAAVQVFDTNKAKSWADEFWATVDHHMEAFNEQGN